MRDIIGALIEGHCLGLCCPSVNPGTARTSRGPSPAPSSEHNKSLLQWHFAAELDFFLLSLQAREGQQTLLKPNVISTPGLWKRFYLLFQVMSAVTGNEEGRDREHKAHLSLPALAQISTSTAGSRIIGGVKVAELGGLLCSSQSHLPGEKGSVPPKRRPWSFSPGWALAESQTQLGGMEGQEQPAGRAQLTPCTSTQKIF